jgi:hypothetical protein
MQPDTFIQIPATLKTAIETVAAADGRSTNDWIIGQLENAVAQAQKLAPAKADFEEEQRKQAEARTEQRLNDLIDKHRGPPGGRLAASRRIRRGGV